jgi:glucose-6-phosphate 1-epimerase
MHKMVTVGALPAVSINTADGAEATITLYGAHLTSWKTADGRERLFMSTKSPLDGSAAIRGGVPVIFPQFSTRGTGQRHGVARLSHWRLAESGAEGPTAWAEFELTEADVPAQLAQGWPHAFTLRLRFTLHAESIEMSFNVRNSGEQDFDFACALHSYFALEAFEHTALEGLQAGDIHFKEKLDNIYPAPSELTLLHTGAGALRLQQQGFSEFVVWNPGADGAAALADMADEEYRQFVCIEPAKVDKKPLAAGAEWTGLHTISLIP